MKGIMVSVFFLNIKIINSILSYSAGMEKNKSKRLREMIASYHGYRRKNT